jgi:protease IV
MLNVHAPRLGLAVVAVLALTVCSSGPPEPSGPELRVIRLDQALQESPEETGFGGAGGVTHSALIDRIHALIDDKDVKGVLLELGELHGAWARAADLRAALQAVRKAGKPVHCYLEGSDNLGYAVLARVCDRISMSPAGILDVVGVSAEALYARELLQTLGLRADMVQIGRFKGAADTATRDDMPEEVRQTMSALLDDLQGELVAAIAERRKLSSADAQALIDRGPFTSEQARAEGLVDDVVFDDAARAVAKKAVKAERVADEQLEPEDKPAGLLDLLQALSGGDEEESASGQRLVLAHLDGTIMIGGDKSFRSAHARAFVRAMRGYADDKDVKALVLRIDSPGGSVLASDMMWHALRRVAKRKPVIVSIGDMAASGGYYVASAGTEIMAQELSIVGSIGVVGGKIVVEDLAERVGVHVERLARGRRAGWTSAAHAFTEDERNAFQTALQSAYERFLARIAEGRHMTREKISPLAEGRIMSARRAQAGGLIDRLGGLRDALARAREKGGLAADAPTEVWPERPTLMQAIAQLTSGGSQALQSSLLSSDQLEGFAELLLAGEASQAAVMPFLLSLH